MPDAAAVPIVIELGERGDRLGRARTAGAWWERAHGAADLPVRLALGGAMLYHGLSKLRGEGPRTTGEMFEGLGLHPGRFWAVAAGAAESFAGAAAVLGIATRPAALAVLVTQAVAVTKVHAPKGYPVLQGGFEYNLALMAIALELLVRGPGTVSAHHAVRRLAWRRDPRRWLGLGARGRAERALALLH